METYEPDDNIAVISPWSDGNASTIEKVSCFNNNDGRKQIYNISYLSRQAMVVAVGYILHPYTRTRYLISVCLKKVSAE